VNRSQLASLLADVATGRVEPSAALERLAHFPTEDLSFAQVDHHRSLRQGLPEVVFCAGKTPEQVVAICEGLSRQTGAFLGTRATADHAAALLTRFPEARWNRIARTVVLPATRSPAITDASVLVVAAGTSDLPVAEEAVETALACGLQVERLNDVGVAGLHRLLNANDALRRASVLIVVAGMEGALPSVVGGLVAAPVIAVPTSIGYGAAFGGIAALLGMLNSCAAGVTVVNIDNGFGAGVAAFRILQP
jgi:pyridinium-3,5-biscarboxylic acid mononucleotide synthase